jgi:hypothetical protein
MHRSTTRWTTAAAAAALLALPVAGAAQTTGSTPQQPPASTQPQPQPQEPTSPTPQQPPATTAQQPAASGQVDATAAKKHLSDAREALSQLTSMPEAAKLQGDARTQVSQLIANFNEMITTQSEWRATFAKVDASLTSLLGPDTSDPGAAAGTAAVGTSGTAGTTGTAGTAGTAGTTGTAPAVSGAGAPNLDPAIRTKLTEFRSHLKLFEKAAGGIGSGADAASGAMPPAAATGSTTSPANPATSAPANPDPSAPNPASPTQPPSSAGATGTSGVTPSPTATMSPSDQAKAAEHVAHSEADKHLDAISDILNKSKTGALTKAQTTELKKHVEQLRALLKQNR